MTTLAAIDQAAAEVRRDCFARFRSQIRAARRHATASTNPAAWWTRHAPNLVDAITHAQLQAVVLADITVAEQLNLQNAPEPDFDIDVMRFVGRNGDGRQLGGLVAYPMVDVIQAYETEDTAAAVAAWDQAEKFWERAGVTAVSDAARIAIAGVMLGTDDTRWIRTVHAPACARCLVLAGKEFRKPTAGFERHPGCDCSMAVVHDWSKKKDDPEIQQMTLPGESYFNRLSVADQDKLLGRAGAQAVRDGADFDAVVNAQRGMTVVTDKFGRKRKTTVQGTRKGSYAAHIMAEYFGNHFEKLPGRRYRTISAARLTPQEIYAQAGGDLDYARKALRMYGYMLPRDLVETRPPHELRVLDLMYKQQRRALARKLRK